MSRYFKWILVFIIAVLLLLLVIWIALQNSSIQNRLTSHLTDRLSDDLNVEISLNNVDIDFFNTVDIGGLYVEDQAGDTLIYADHLYGDIHLFSLLDKKIILDPITLEGAKVHLKENGDSSNYQFLIDYFSGSGKSSSSSSPWYFNLHGLNITQSELQYQSNQTETNAWIEDLSIITNDLDIEHKTLSLKSMDMTGVSVTIGSDKTTPTSNSTNKDKIIFPAIPWLITLDQGSIKDSRFVNIINGHQAKKGKFDANHIDLDIRAFELKDLYYKEEIKADIKKIQIEDRSNFAIEKGVAKLLLSDQKLHLSDLHLQTRHSSINGELTLEYDDFHMLSHDFDNVHLHADVASSYLKSKDLRYFDHLVDMSAFNLDEFQKISILGDIKTHRGRYDIKQLRANIDDMELLGSGMFALSHPIGDSKISFDISKLRASADKIDRIFTTIKLPTEVKNLGWIRASGRGQGSINSLSLQDIVIDTDTNTALKASGVINGLPNTDAIQYDLDLQELTTLPEEIIQEDQLSPELQRLGKINIIGKIKGTLSEYNINTKINTALGNADINMIINQVNDERKLTYDGKIALKEFELGEFLQDNTYGKTSLTADIDGAGTDLNHLNADIKADVKEVYYNQKVYRNGTIAGNIKDKGFDGNIEIDEDGMKINYDGKISLDENKPSFVFEMQLDTLNLAQFGIDKLDYKLSGHVKSNLNGENYDQLEGYAVIEDLIISSRSYTYVPDTSITLVVKNLPNGDKAIDLQSPFAELQAEGYILPTEILHTMRVFIDNYFPTRVIKERSGKNYVGDYTRQNFDIKLKTRAINKLIPLFSRDVRIKNFQLDAAFDSYAPHLEGKGYIDSLKYKDFIISRGDVYIDGDRDKLIIDAKIKDIVKGNDVMIPSAEMKSVTQDDIVDLNIDLHDKEGNARFSLGSAISTEGDYVKVMMHDSLTLNKNRWSINDANFIKYKQGEILINDLDISTADQSLQLSSTNKDGITDINADFNNFKISEITTLLGKDEDFIQGRIIGDLTYHDFFNTPYLTTDLSVKDIVYDQKPVGDLNLDAEQNTTNNTIEGGFDLAGEHNDALGSITYNIGTTRWDGFLEVAKMEMRLVDPFLVDIIEESDGYLYGDFQIQGSPQRPDISGNLLFENASTVISLSKTRYRIKDQKISFDNRIIHFDDITFYDQNDNTAIVNGRITHRSFDDMYLNLKADTKGLQLLNTTAINNPVLYGNVYMDAEVSITGSPEDMKVNATAKVVNNSELTLSPFSTTNEIVYDDYIVFGHPDTLKRNKQNVNDFVKKDEFPVDVNMQLDIEEDSKFIFYVNPITGDRLEANGIANLNVQLKKNGDILLYGIYQATKGIYKFSYSFVEKDFLIEDGGSVVFNGDPLKAKLDINAIYEAYPNVYDLLKGEVSTEQYGSDINKKVKTNVILNLTGELLKPTIDLDIKIPSEDNAPIVRDAKDKLYNIRNNTNELNRQVFGLMLFDQFLVTDNVISGLESAPESIVLSSVSSLITNQLNKMASGLIKGVEVNFDVNNYTTKYADQNLVTELGVDLSKRFLDDRLTLKAGGNFNLESSDSNTEFATLAGDFILEYKLNERGNYILKVFSKTNYDRLIDENNTKNGIGIFIKKDLD